MNRKPFNRGGFNRSSTTTSSATGLAQLKLGASPVFANRTISVPISQSNLALTNNLSPTVIKSAECKAALILLSLGNATKALDGGTGAALIVLTADASQSVQGEAVITLEGLVLAPGGELIINTVDMTVTINAESGMQYFSADSEFFALLNGANTILYNDGETNRTINLDVIWKDRWL